MEEFYMNKIKIFIYWEILGFFFDLNLVWKFQVNFKELVFFQFQLLFL